MTTKSLITRRSVLAASAALPAVAGVALGMSAQPVNAQTAQTSTPYGVEISAAFPFEKRMIEVNGSSIAYVDEGQGQPVVFLHGNPTSSYLWRNVIPHVTDGYRAIAPDLIGMGDSGKPDIDYSFAEHAAYLDAFFEALDLENVTLVVHDWGSALGMRYARLNPDRVAALAFMEAIVAPVMPVGSYDAMPPEQADFFKLMKSDVGANMVLNDNFFVEVLLPESGVLRDMTAAEMDAYRAPFPTPQSRKPVLAWPREVPIGGTPANVVSEIEANSEWLYGSSIPKLVFYADPGALTPKQVVDYMSANMTNLEVRFVGAGTHFIQEDHPLIIGQGLADWLRRNELMEGN